VQSVRPLDNHPTSHGNPTSDGSGRETRCARGDGRQSGQTTGHTFTEEPQAGRPEISDFRTLLTCCATANARRVRLSPGRSSCDQNSRWKLRMSRRLGAARLTGPRRPHSLISRDPRDAVLRLISRSYGPRCAIVDWASYSGMTVAAPVRRRSRFRPSTLPVLSKHGGLRTGKR
jgi:hypothetical protein